MSGERQGRKGDGCEGEGREGRERAAVISLAYVHAHSSKTWLLLSLLRPNKPVWWR